MGITAPWLEEVQKQAQDMPWPTRVLVGVSDMAKLMADSDLAIGASGATSWERCCLGVPTIMFMLAVNQLKVAQGLEQAGAAVLVRPGQRIEYQFVALFASLLSNTEKLLSMSRSAAGIVDGMGTSAVLSLLED
jgi:spore coat polysaccharide biosynthesis predicted glycosyltransferase SpsG